MLVPGDDPPFLVLRLGSAPGEFPLRLRQGNDLIRRLEGSPGGQAELVTRILAARAGPYPQEFTADPADEPALLAALAAPPELAPGRLADLRDALRSRAAGSSVSGAPLAGRRRRGQCASTAPESDVRPEAPAIGGAGLRPAEPTAAGGARSPW